MSLPDIIILLLLFIFALSGIHRGFVWELLTCIGLALGFGLTYAFRTDLLDLVYRITSSGWQRQWGSALIFLVFFLIIYLGFTILGKHLSEGLHKTPFKWPDRVLGFAGGAFKGALLIGMLVAALEWTNASARFRSVLNQSEIIRWGKRAAYDLIHWESPIKRQWAILETTNTITQRNEYISS
ncbi:CvpA family protein [candidate division KSB1 bacterium]|nr:MAG: CvpA family protein [candidate division KSB1 bacterium]